MCSQNGVRARIECSLLLLVIDETHDGAARKLFMIITFRKQAIFNCAVLGGVLGWHSVVVVRLWRKLCLCGLGGSAQGVTFPPKIFEIPKISKIKRHYQRKSGEPGSISPVTGNNAWRREK